MNNLAPIIRDLGLILIIAGITTLLFKKLKQPVVLGYILAGFLVSANFHFFPNVTDGEDIKIWAEIGVVFLLFTLGLEFSFKRLMSIGGAASVTALIEVSCMLVVGFSIGRLLGWQLMDCIFLGGILSMSSTTIILRAFDELGVKNKRFAGLVFGVLIIEDIVAVVLLVLLSTIAVSRQFAGMEMVMSVLKLCFFLLLWFVGGIFFIPTFLRKTSKLLNDETMLIISLGLCLMMVLLASSAGFSPALGAFIMGSILAETTQAERIEHLVKPVKDLFGAIFFVSVGMLIDIKVLADYALPIVLIIVFFLFFKTLVVTLGALVAGQPLKIAIHAGMSQAQIGEFSFIIATLGLSLGVISHFLYPIAVAVSAITTFTTPYMIRSAGRFYRFVEKHLPARWLKTLTRYSTGTQTISQASDWQLVLRSFLTQLFVFSLVILGIIVLFSEYLRPRLLQQFANPETANFVTAAFCFVVLSPFLWAYATRKSQPTAFANLWRNKRFRAPLIFLEVIRGGLVITFISVFLLLFFSFSTAIIGLMLLLSLGFAFSKKIHRFYVRLEERFFNNYNDRERQLAADNRIELAPWDAHIAQFRVPADSSISAQNLEEIATREKFGVNIAMIKRGDSYIINAPSRFEQIYPGDVLFAIGTDDQLEQFRLFLESEINTTSDSALQDVGIVLKKLKVSASSPFLGQTIRESGIREKTQGLVVGLERNQRRILNPDSHLKIQLNDMLWIVGNKTMIESLKRKAEL
ncbi:MAG: cation:proton antiporter [Bacteroidetes bacterium]|nr:cation:proton antiporter [Bacteroidota bacterium]